MAGLSLLTTACLLLIWIPVSQQCWHTSGPKLEPDLDLDEEIERKKEEIDRRKEEIKAVCYNCVSEWSAWSACDSRCGQGTKRRERRVIADEELCDKLLGDFKCIDSLTHTDDCNSGCPDGGRPSYNMCIGCPRGRTGECCEIEIFCNPPQPPPNGKVEGMWRDKHTPGSTVKYSCYTGFNLIGDDTASCSYTGKWSNPDPTCKEIKCDMPIKKENVKILGNEKSQTGYAFGEKIFFDCEEGYTLVGHKFRICERGQHGSGAWTGNDVYCKPTECPQPKTPPNGEIINASTSYQYGHTVNFDCNEGYKLTGSDALKCMASGSWFGIEPNCEAITCDPPGVPRHGKVHIHKEGIKAFASFQCDEGYELQPNVSRTCMTDGKWSGTEPKCIVVSCGDPGTPTNGYTRGGTFTYGSNVTFHCVRGYEMIGGAKMIKCQSDGQWRGEKPTCNACQIGFFSAGDRCVKCPDKSTTVFNASVSNDQCLCQEENGFYGPPGGPCEEVFCTKLNAPDNGKITDCGNKVSDVCNFSCNDGFVLERGLTKRTCQSIGDWVGTQPFCVPCKLNTYKSGERICSPCPKHSHTEKPGQMLTGCVCDKGYEGPDGGPCNDTDECQTNQGKGPCSDTCENSDGGYHCTCSIHGYEIDPQNNLNCIVDKQCRNLTKDHAPENGGLMCHYYIEENSQHCTIKCNPGYELPTRINDYETCGPVTNYTWSFQASNVTAILPPCIPEFFPDFRVEGETTYFAAACENLTEVEKNAAKQKFANRLNAKNVCSRGTAKICNIKDMAIICGRVTRRRKRRGVDVLEHSVDFAYNVSALRFEEKTMDCHGKICPLFRLAARYCDHYCKPMYKRYLRAAVEYAKRQLTDIHQDTNKLRDLSFNVESLRFVPEEEGFQVSDVFKECPEGMVAINDMCVPCKAGTYLNENKTDCVKCPHNNYQDKDAQSTCIPCTSLGPGFSTHGIGSTTCHLCIEGRWGDNCVNHCNCAHGNCNPFDGSCICPSGWEGPRCERDINSCVPGSCYPGVTCVDEPPPGAGFSCGPCPTGYHGDGFDCTPLSQKHSVGLMASEL